MTLRVFTDLRIERDKFYHDFGQAYLEMMIKFRPVLPYGVDQSGRLK
jgi:hypothetical protein